MKLRILTLALLAAASPAAAQEPAQPEGEIYAASGTEPFWGVTFEDGKMIYTGDEVRIEVPRPRPVTTRAGVHVYRTPRLTVEISHEGRCNDGMSENEWPDTVRVRFGTNRTGHALEGCGGGILPPARLADTDWYIVDINGAIVGGEDYELHFDGEGRLSGRAGCNRFSGPYTQRSHALTFGTMINTRMACPGERMTHERRMLELLGGPVQLYYRSGSIMYLQQRDGSPGISVTLRRQ